MQVIKGSVKNVAILLLSAMTWCGCVSSIDKGFELADEIHDDEDYYGKYQASTRGGDLINNFDVRFRLHATYLSPEFRSALVKRLQKLYMEDAAGAFEEASSKAGFIVTVYGLERETADLSNTSHWTLIFETKDGPVRPVLVRKINDKIRWRNFFETISPWTSDYLVVFDRAAVNPDATNLVEKPKTKLVLATGEGKVQLEW